MNCILYSGLITKYNQISQNVDTTAHCPITMKTPERGLNLLLLTLNIFHTLFYCYNAEFEQINTDWSEKL